MAPNWSKVEQAVASAEEKASVGVAVIAPDGSTWSKNGDRQFQAASTVKIPLMIEIYRMIDRDELALDDVFRLERSDKTPGSGVLTHMHAGIELTLADILYLMMSISDNTATNYLIDLAGFSAVNTTMQELGMTNSVLARKMAGRSAANPDLENWAAPSDYARSIQAILDGSAASASSCTAMVATLEKQQNGRRIGRNVPTSDGYSWGSKTGSLDGICNDVGFVATPDGTLVIAVFTSEVPDQIVGEQLIANITGAALDSVFG
jgi:beta-lactamase class A